MRLTADVRSEALSSELAKMTRMGVEVGVHRGMMSKRLLRDNPNLLLFMVDPWDTRAYRDTSDEYARSDGDLYKAMREATLAVEPYKERAQIILETSAKASEMFDDRSLDFVFIDADHSYEAVQEDIALWWPKVRIGGLLCGHDYDDKHPGVQKAVQEFIGDRELRVGGNNTWFITKWD